MSERGDAIMICDDCARPFVAAADGEVRKCTDAEVGSKDVQSACYEVALRRVFLALAGELASWPTSDFGGDPLRIGSLGEDVFFAADLARVAEHVGRCDRAKRLVRAALATKIQPSYAQFVVALKAFGIPLAEEVISLDDLNLRPMGMEGMPKA